MRYPVCGMAHPAIDALRELLAEHRLAAKDVKAVRVAASKFVVDMVGRPYRPGKNPEVDAQFNLSYCLATVLQTGSMQLGDLARSEEHTSELQSLMRISSAVFCLKKKKK